MSSKQSKPRPAPQPSSKSRTEAASQRSVEKLQAPKGPSRAELALASASAQMTELRSLLGKTPPLADLIVCRSARDRAEMTRAISAALKSAEAAYSALVSIPSKNSLSPANNALAKSLKTEARSALKHLEDFSSRAATLAHGMDGAPPDFPLLLRDHEVKLITEMKQRRSLFWEKLYEIPLVQHIHFEDLRRVAAKELKPGTVISMDNAGVQSERALFLKARACVEAVLKLHPKGNLLLLPQSKRASVARLLLEVPPSPDTSLDFFAHARSLQGNLSELESRILCRHKSLQAAKAACDPDVAQCQELRRLLGGSALQAHESLARISALATPYLDLKHYVVLANKGLVLSHISRSPKLRLFQDDLIQEAYIGLLRAVDRYDETRGWRVCTYALWWIRQASGRAFNEVSRVIHLPAHAISSLTQLSREMREESASPAPDVLAAKTGLSVKEVLVLQPHVNSVSSLSAPVSEVGEMSRLDTVADRNAPPAGEEAEKAEIRRLITDSLRYLDRREREILTLRFGLGDDSPRPLTLDEIGRMQGITKERIRQIQAGALAKLVRVSWQKGTALNILRQLI